VVRFATLTALDGMPCDCELVLRLRADSQFKKCGGKRRDEPQAIDSVDGTFRDIAEGDAADDVKANISAT
jgi:hypothetical protein